MPYSPVGAIGLFTEEPEEQCVCSLGEKLGDTLPGSSATREERQAHNLVVSPVYKSV